MTWMTTNPHAADAGRLAAYRAAPKQPVLHGLLVCDDEGVLWLHTTDKRSLWVSDLRGQWYLFPRLPD